MAMQARSKLKSLYASGLSSQEKRKAKNAIFEHMREHYRRLKSGWDGYTGYDQWISRDLNNAKLSSIATYHQYVPAFQQLLKKNKGDLVEFYKQVKTLSELDQGEREKRLRSFLNANGDKY
jgi:predicted aminopeptidase